MNRRLNYTTSKTVISTLTLGLLVVLAGCSNKGEPGSQDDPPPFVSAQVFNVNSSTTGTLEARSGSDVTLSGSTSDGIDDPILSFQWQQTDNSGYTVDLYERSASTVVFAAPKIPLTETNDVVLNFTLTVTDADGVTASDSVSVQIIPVDDVDHFLIAPSIVDEYLLYVATDPGASLANDIPVDITVTSKVQWNDRAGLPHSMDFDTKTYSGVVPLTASAGPVAGPNNLSFRVHIPYLDIDLINANFTGANRSSRLELELVDAAIVTTTITFQQNASGNVNVYLVDNGMTNIVPPQSIDGSADIPIPASPIIDAVSGGSSFDLDPELLRQQLDLESKLSANNYYNCIDPTASAATFLGWLQYAGVQSGLINLGTDVNTIVDTLTNLAVTSGFSQVTHTAYGNNYDLGFGRDMYTLEDDNGNVYSFVVNYPNLENTLSQRNDFAIVVMEFSAAPTGNCGDGTFADDATGRKIVKFYAYVPDKINGTFPRVPSMNFDGRGEKYLPGVCTACHGGSQDAQALNSLLLTTIDANEADLSAGFMPWDLDSLLYTDTIANANLIDPIYAGDQISAAITQQFSRETQQAAFRQQNLHALKTYTYSVETMRRFEEPIRLVHGWYGNDSFTDGLDFSAMTDGDLLAIRAQLQTLPTNDFDSSYVQPGWVGQEALYQNVFARNCRLCHVQIDPGPDDILHFANYDDFIVHEKLIAEVFERGTMPSSRFTMDRFWVDFYGNQSAAEQLRDHLNADLLAGNDVGATAIPGRPAAIITPSAEPALNADVFLDFDQQQVFDGSQSLFADSYQWLLDGMAVSMAENYAFSAGTPGDSNQVGLVVTDAASGVMSPQKNRRISVNNNVPNPSGLSSGSVTAGQSVDIDVFQGLCAGNPTDAPACRSVFGDITTGNAPLIALSGTPVNGTATVNQGAGTITFQSTQPAANGAGQFALTLTDSFGEVSTASVVNIPVNPSNGPDVSVPDTCLIAYMAGATTVMGDDPVDCPDPLLNDTSAFPPINLVSVGATNVTGSAVTAIGNSISYEPASFFFNSSTATARADGFQYTVVDSSTIQANGSVSVTVNAQMPYNDDGDGATVEIASNVLPTCEGSFCHGSRAVTWTFTNLFNSATTTIPGGNSLSVTRGAATTEADLLTSRLFKIGCNINFHDFGGNQLCNASPTDPLDASELNTRGMRLLNWVLEGAANN